VTDVNNREPGTTSLPRYVGHRGERPIAITWRLHRPADAADTFAERIRRCPLRYTSSQAVHHQGKADVSANMPPGRH
jgi:hypothetical protein